MLQSLQNFADPNFDDWPTVFSTKF